MPALGVRDAAVAALARGDRPAAAPPAHVVATGISVDFAVGGLRQRVLHEIGISIPKGGFVSLIGPSGCGKSTLLKVLAGLITPTSGTVTIGGVAPAEAARRHLIGLVFQDATLLPWRTALENAAFLLEVADKGMSRQAARERAAEMLRLVGLADAAHKRPSQLSGGMQQRVAIARALALDPEVLMMDEPFGALDAITREEMIGFLLEIWQRTHKTIILVTHSIDEAVFLSREVHVMAANPARIIESLPIDLPQERSEAIYGDPGFVEMTAALRRLLREGHGGARR
ncbi:MAG TPA: ABC transporter ATP-binding protein [Stellaceae bacterium]|nr:ABC transporter ATP-binding protein [Stellaceae bacterium]